MIPQIELRITAGRNAVGINLGVKVGTKGHPRTWNLDVTSISILVHPLHPNKKSLD